MPPSSYLYSFSYFGEAAQALTHFFYESTDGKLILADIQGQPPTHEKPAFLSDVMIHSVDHRMPSVGNFGSEGVNKWTEFHICNKVCTALQLTPFATMAPEPRKIFRSMIFTIHPPTDKVTVLFLRCKSFSV